MCVNVEGEEGFKLLTIQSGPQYFKKYVEFMWFCNDIKVLENLKNKDELK